MELILSLLLLLIVYKLLTRLISNDNNSDDNFFKKDYFTKKRHGSRCFNFDLEPGEEILLQDLKKRLSDKDYFIFNNIIIPIKNGGSSQIDHLIISKYGIFVLENKKMRGFIFGNKINRSWTQTFSKFKKYTFQNPLKQNLGHIKALQEHLGGMDNKYFNIIAFSEEGEFKTKLPDNVMYYDEVVSYIKNFKKPIISTTKLEEILGKIFILCQTVDITNEEHIAYLKTKYAKRKHPNI